MKRKLSLLLVCIVFLSSFSFSQNETDALRYSMLNPSGTARFNAMGTSFGAIGADASAIQFNPAGLGVFRSSELSFTSSFYFTNAHSDFLKDRNSGFASNCKFDQFSYLGSIPVGNNSVLRSVNLGFTYNKINKFNENIIISSVNDQNSFTDWFAEKAQNTYYNNLEDFYTFQALEASIIDPTNIDTTNYKSIYEGVYGQRQSQLINRSGSQGEYNFALSFNLKNKLFLGSSIGLQTVSFYENKTLEEVDQDDNIPFFNNFTFKENFETNGSGVNFKIGAIYSPLNWIRFGASIHTRTFYDLKDQYQTHISSSFNNQKSKNRKSEYGIYDYKLKTPFRANASLGFIIEKQALINIDYEYVDYSTNKFSSLDGYSFIDENKEITSAYKASHNLKLGMEYKMGPFAFRLGTAYLDSPYSKEHINKNAGAMLYSCGVGARLNNVYFDLAYSHLSSKEKTYFMYSGYGVDSPKTQIKNNRNSVFLTVGFKI